MLVWDGRESKINHFLFMNDLRLFGKSYEEIDSLLQTVRTFSTDIGMEFGIKTCGMLVLKRGKIAKMEGIVLPDGQVMKEIDVSEYKYLGVLETDQLKQKETNDMCSKEYKRRLIKLVLKTKLSGKNKIMAVNTWAVATLRYSAGVVDWTVDELKLDRKTRKMMTLHGALHPKRDVDRLYLPRQKDGRALIGCDMCVKAEENNLAWYVKNSNERLMEGVRKTKILNSEEAQEKSEFKQDRQNANLDRW